MQKWWRIRLSLGARRSHVRLRAPSGDQTEIHKAPPFFQGRREMEVLARPPAPNQGSHMPWAEAHCSDMPWVEVSEWRPVAAGSSTNFLGGYLWS